MKILHPSAQPLNPRRAPDLRVATQITYCGIISVSWIYGTPPKFRSEVIFTGSFLVVIIIIIIIIIIVTIIILTIIVIITISIIIIIITIITIIIIIIIIIIPQSPWSLLSLLLLHLRLWKSFYEDFEIVIIEAISNSIMYARINPQSAYFLLFFSSYYFT